MTSIGSNHFANYNNHYNAGQSQQCDTGYNRPRKDMVAFEGPRPRKLVAAGEGPGRKFVSFGEGPRKLVVAGEGPRNFPVSYRPRKGLAAPESPNYRPRKGLAAPEGPISHRPRKLIAAGEGPGYSPTLRQYGNRPFQMRPSFNSGGGGFNMQNILQLLSRFFKSA